MARKTWAVIIEDKIIRSLQELEAEAGVIRQGNLKRRRELEEKLARELAGKFRINSAEAELIVRSRKK
jgi:hypothetical protein